jgi:hypothetical protein
MKLNCPAKTFYQQCQCPSAIIGSVVRNEGCIFRQEEECENPSVTKFSVDRHVPDGVKCIKEEEMKHNETWKLTTKRLREKQSVLRSIEHELEGMNDCEPLTNEAYEAVRDTLDLIWHGQIKGISFDCGGAKGKVEK